MDGTTGKTDNNSSTPCDNAEKKTPSTKITNEILTAAEEEFKKSTDNDEERTTAVNSGAGADGVGLHRIHRSAGGTQPGTQHPGTLFRRITLS